ncbi:DivIVA domain-containing protein, partial [Nocardia cyriacigeorgica]|nr:DivIVA domain-containing protein [Nocardia cyriacigeorgica]
KAEQARLVAQTEVVRAAHAESARLIDTAQAEADRVRAECDDYVDERMADFGGRLAEMEETLSTTRRSISRGRAQMRGGPAVDYPEYAAEHRR